MPSTPPPSTTLSLSHSVCLPYRSPLQQLIWLPFFLSVTLQYPLSIGNTTMLPMAPGPRYFLPQSNLSSSTIICIYLCSALLGNKQKVSTAAEGAGVIHWVKRMQQNVNAWSIFDSFLALCLNSVIQLTVCGTEFAFRTLVDNIISGKNCIRNASENFIDESNNKKINFLRI